MTKKSKLTAKDPRTYKERFYRQILDISQLLACECKVRETDLHILASQDVSSEAHHLVVQFRNHLERYISKHPQFLTALDPLPLDPLAPPIVKNMQKVAHASHVGPMAAVAGAIAEFVGLQLLVSGVSEIIIENGGDIFIARQKDCRVLLFAGSSPLSNRIGIKVPFGKMPLGVCTSSGTVGHSLSFGRADAVTVVAKSTGLADAAATSICNKISDVSDIARGLDFGQKIPGILGILIVCGKNLGAWGEIELIRV